MFLSFKVFIESSIAILLIIVGLVLPINLKPIWLSPNFKMKKWEEVMGRMDYAIFNHRGSMKKK
jgi:hypothetical protein